MINFMKTNWHKIAAIILVLMGVYFLLKGNLIAAENPHAKRHIYLHYYKALSYDDCHTYQQKMKFHKENGDRCFNDAKDRCWYLPNLNYRQNARYCITNAGALVAYGTPQSRLIAVIATTLVQYSIDCCDEWEYIKTKLYWAEYHYEMAEFYQGLI